MKWHCKPSKQSDLEVKDDMEKILNVEISSSKDKQLSMGKAIICNVESNRS